MTEQHERNVLHNMSGCSRSYETVRPRQVPNPTSVARPETVITGAAVAETCLVRVDLPLRMKPRTLDPGQLLGMYQLILGALGEPIPNTTEAGESQLRTVADRAMTKYELVGCFLVSAERSHHEAGLTVLELIDPVLALAILAKSSGSICVAGKTPNLSLHLLTRTLWTRDPRLIQIAKAGR